MGLVRSRFWAANAFHNFLLDRLKLPFAWQSNDCALFAADGIQAITGVDIASDFRGKYTDEAGAFATIKAVTGGSTVEDAAIYCAAQHGLVEWANTLFAQRGDLVVLEDGGRLIAGLVHLSGRHIAAVGEDGLKKIPISLDGRPVVKRAWHY